LGLGSFSSKGHAITQEDNKTKREKNWLMQNETTFHSGIWKTTFFPSITRILFKSVSFYFKRTALIVPVSQQDKAIPVVVAVTVIIFFPKSEFW